MKNIIFIEGVSGVGKSTTVKLLGQELSKLGHYVKCHFEGDADSPLDLCWTAYLSLSKYKNLLLNYHEYKQEFEKNLIYKNDYILLRYQIGSTSLFPPEIHQKLSNLESCYNPTNKVPLTKFKEVFLTLWNNYINSKNEYDYEIFDASLVSHMTNDLLRNYNVRQEELIKYINDLLYTIKHYNPIIFYLLSNNVHERLAKARKSRNQIPLSLEKLSFWEKRKQIDIQTLSKIDTNVHMLDITDENWNVALNNIISCII